MAEEFEPYTVLRRRRRGLVVLRSRRPWLVQPVAAAASRRVDVVRRSDEWSPGIGIWHTLDWVIQQYGCWPEVPDPGDPAAVVKFLLAGHEQGFR